MHKHKHWLAGALVIAAASFPGAAQGRVMTDSTGHPSAPAPAPSAAPAPGFQWDDAGIGAAGTVLLLGAGALAAGVARRRRAVTA
jgi:hypothetical protein